MRHSTIRLMEVCGTHTMAIAQSGIKKLLPAFVKLISGPGCPVCVTDQKVIDAAIETACLKDVIMTTFGDMMRVPGSTASLMHLKSEGHDVRIVYSCLEALELAEQHPDKKVVFMGVGFETTAPTVAAALLEAKRRRVKNFFVLSHFKLIFPALELLARAKDLKIDGFLCPGHVSVITGSRPFEKVASRHKIPCVIAGFEPSDIVGGIAQLIDQIKRREHRVEIAYPRVVQRDGNRKAQGLLREVFEARDVSWRGLGVIRKSGLKLKKVFADFDAEKRLPVKVLKLKPVQGCLCGAVLTGRKDPQECRLFKKACSPETPVGPCMVSSEGTCAAAYRYA